MDTWHCVGHMYTVNAKTTTISIYNYEKFIIAAIAILTFTAAAFAADHNDKALTLFKAAYPGATHVHYKTVGELVSIRFQLDSTSMQAFYNNEGEQVAVSRVIGYQKLPGRAQSEIAGKFVGYTATEVIEMEHSGEGLCYYVSLVGNNRKIVLQVSPGGEVSVFKK